MKCSLVLDMGDAPRFGKLKTALKYSLLMDTGLEFDGIIINTHNCFGMLWPGYWGQTQSVVVIISLQ